VCPDLAARHTKTPDEVADEASARRRADFKPTFDRI
jgi:hypothetical protein